MNLNEEHSDLYDRLGRFLAGESPAEEIAWVETWLAESPENLNILEGLAEVWTLGGPATGPVNVDAAWEKVRVRTGIPAAPSQTSTPRNWNRWLSYAAILLLPLAGFIYLLVSSAEKPEFVHFATQSKIETVTLPDGSVVTLNANSTLRYPSEFKEETRTVELTGEGFFEVERDPSHPFLVQAQAAEITVLGTSFNVKTSDAAIEVAVTTGKVRFSGQPAEGTPTRVDLDAGEAAVYHPETETMEPKREGTGNAAFWKNRTLDYHNVQLESVIREVNQIYPGEIQLANPALNSCPLTSTYQDKSLEEIAELVAATFNLEITQDGNTFILDGTACE